MRTGRVLRQRLGTISIIKLCLLYEVELSRYSYTYQIDNYRKRYWYYFMTTFTLAPFLSFKLCPRLPRIIHTYLYEKSYLSGQSFWAD